MKLRVGLVGLGAHWESRHKPALRALATRFEVRAVYDQVLHRAVRTAEEFKAAPVDSFRNLVARPDIDAVLVLDRQWTEMLPVLAACEAHKAVYCAAPWKVELDYATRLRDRIDESGVAYMSELERRHAPATLRLKELIATALGKPRMLFCHQRLTDSQESSTAEQPATSWRGLVELIDWCIYVVDQPPESVVGIVHESPSGGYSDYEMMNLSFRRTDEQASEVIAQMSCGRYVSPQWKEALNYRTPAPLQVVCERGIAFVDLPASVTWFDDAGRHTESLESERPAGEQLLAQFHREVTSLVRGTRCLDDAFRAVAIAAIARSSCSDGRRVTIDV